MKLRKIRIFALNLMRHGSIGFEPVILIIFLTFLKIKIDIFYYYSTFLSLLVYAGMVITLLIYETIRLVLLLVFGMSTRCSIYLSAMKAKGCQFCKK